MHMHDHHVSVHGWNALYDSVTRVTKSGLSQTKVGIYLILDRIHRDPPRSLSAVQVLELVEQMLAAVDVAHRKGIMHCDLKPQNMLVVRTSDKILLKLCDFGIARQLRETATHVTEDHGFGTTKYMAPEMVHSDFTDDKVRVGFGVDVWAIGVILHQLLHDGRTPHTHLLKRGQVRLIMGISHETSARVQQVGGQVVAHASSKQHNVCERNERLCMIIVGIWYRNERCATGRRTACFTLPLVSWEIVSMRTG